VFFKLSFTLCIFVSWEILDCLLIVLVGSIDIFPIEKPRFTSLVPLLVLIIWAVGVSQGSTWWHLAIITCLKDAHLSCFYLLFEEIRMLKSNIVVSHIFCLQKWHIDKDMKICVGKTSFILVTLNIDFNHKLCSIVIFCSQFLNNLRFFGM